MPAHYLHVICIRVGIKIGIPINIAGRLSLNMEETLCNIEILKNPRAFVGKVQSELGGSREYKSSNFEDVLEQIIMDVQDELEGQQFGY